MSRPLSVPPQTLDPTHQQPAKEFDPRAVESHDWSAGSKKFLESSGAGEEAAAAAHGLTSDLAEQFRHSGWAPFRKRVDTAMAELTEVSERRLAAFRFCGCDAYVEQRRIGHDNPMTEYRIRSTKCHDRFCVPCSKERAARIRESLLVHMYGKKELSLLTLTLKSSKVELTKTMDRITKCFRSLRNKPMWKKRVKGGVATIETKLGSGSGEWHCHFHVVAEMKYIDQRALSEEWLRITGDSSIVDIRRVGALGGAVQYITKYITKAMDHSIVNSREFLKQAIVGFTGRRLVSTFGTWRGLKLMEKPHEEISGVSVTEWWSCGPLDAFIRRARAGSADAIRVMRQICRGFRPDANAPPDPGPAYPEHISGV